MTGVTYTVFEALMPVPGLPEGLYLITAAASAGRIEGRIVVVEVRGGLGWGAV